MSAPATCWRGASPIRQKHFVFEELAGLVRVHIQRDAAKQISGAQVSAPRALSIDVAVPTDVIAACAGVSEEGTCLPPGTRRWLPRSARPL